MSKGKGSAFEREVCKTLSLWWSGGVDDSLFWRTAMSGGRATVRAKKGKMTRAHCGDITAVDDAGSTLTKLITFELKRGYNRGTLSDLVDKPDRARPSILEQFIVQAMTAAKHANTPYWMIIHKRDQKRILVHYPLKLHVAWSRSVNSLFHYPASTTRFSLKTGTKVAFVSYPFDDFTSLVLPGHLIALYEEFVRCSNKSGSKTSKPTKTSRSTSTRR